MDDRYFPVSDSIHARFGGDIPSTLLTVAYPALYGGFSAGASGSAFCLDKKSGSNREAMSALGRANPPKDVQTG